MRSVAVGGMVVAIVAVPAMGARLALYSRSGVRVIGKVCSVAGGGIVVPVKSIVVVDVIAAVMLNSVRER